MVTRSQLFKAICASVGEPLCAIVDPGTGWPGLADILTASGTTRCALHVSLFGSHSRQAYEMRFQNPANGTPVISPAGAIPILLGRGVVGAQEILVAVDGSSRLGRRARFSILFHQDLLTGAAQDGWAEYRSNTGERIFGFHPKLLGIFIDSLLLNVFPSTQEMAQAAAASGVVQDNTAEAANRARGVATRLLRDARFSKDVRHAYSECCAMCGLSLELVVGAHIFPVNAPGAPDKVWNGMALCQNHHAAFDKHFIWVDPAKHDIKIRPDVLGIAASDAAAKVFTQNTRPKIAAPTTVGHRPRADMFTQRYGHYKGLYDWAV